MEETVEIAYDEHIVEAETADAWLLEIDDKRVWFPKSRCELDEKRKTVELPQWLAEKKDLV